MTYMLRGDQDVKRAAEHHEVMRAVTPKPKPERKATKAQRKKRLEGKLDRLNRELIFWRDAECVEKDADGCNCGGGWELGHIIRRSDSAWLKLLFWNLVKQCFEHNHFHGDPQLHKVMGAERMDMLRAEMLAHRNEAPSVEELKRRISVVQYLLDYRPANYVFEDLVNMGYYGPLNLIARQHLDEPLKAEAV